MVAALTSSATIEPVEAGAKRSQAVSGQSLAAIADTTRENLCVWRDYSLKRPLVSSDPTENRHCSYHFFQKTLFIPFKRYNWNGR